jgi:hypothetical protein
MAMAERGGLAKLVAACLVACGGYRLDGNKLLDPQLVRGFSDFEVDGLRTDVDGRIYLARLSAGKIAIIAAGGSLEREVPLRGKQPTNLTFGGPDGRTVFVTPEGRPLHRGLPCRPSRPPAMPANAWHVLILPCAFLKAPAALRQHACHCTGTAPEYPG